jgi:hypothetical protein
MARKSMKGCSPPGKPAQSKELKIAVSRDAAFFLQLLLRVEVLSGVFHDLTRTGDNRMMTTTFLRAAVAVFAIGLCLCLSVAAQQQPAPAQDTNYDVMLQLVIGTNDPSAKNEMPTNLNAVTSQMKSSFNFSSYHLASTFVGRIANNGHFDYNSVANIEGKDLSSSVPTFLDWSLSDLAMVPGTRNLRAQAFTFGARVPVYVGDASKGQQAVNYEHIGVSLMRVGLNQNVPTLIGTLHLPGTSGTIFLVMTIRPTES